ncbi:hypothetical protein MBRA1_003373 [Malassezia brasiliensis]|uniref:Uncharacterized protein n=1 Tax=Malassezia brasiliensis TaxID=1821822 RepID=A0AAF0DUR4_9BASI|nr:hypothetical protein MBRA1_003373 [Malassezia brasiliensis]
MAAVCAAGVAAAAAVDAHDAERGASGAHAALASTHRLVRRSMTNHDVEASGMPWQRAIAFVAAVGGVLLFVLTLGLVLQVTDRPRMEARHPGAVPVPGGYQAQRARSQRHTSQLPRPPSGRPQLGSSPSQIGLLDQVQPQPVASRRARREGRPSRQLPAPPQHLLASEPAPYLGLQMPPTARGQLPPTGAEYAEYTSGAYAPGPSRAPRMLPLPPDLGAPLIEAPGAPYSEYAASHSYADSSPFETQEVLTQSSTKQTPRSSRGYVPLPEPPIQMTHVATEYVQPEVGYYDTPTYQQEVAHYADAGREVRRKASTRSRGSGLERKSSQLSRVDSIGAGDPRRHSRKLPQPPVPRMSTTERIRALRSVMQDSYLDDPPLGADAAQPAPPVSVQALSGADALGYPVREEHRYATHYGHPNPYDRRAVAGSDVPRHRYYPI